MVTAVAPTQTLTFSRTIAAPIEQVYQSFVNRDDICDWLCYNALMTPEVGEYLFINWYDRGAVGQTHAYGVFTALDENTRVAFTWHDTVYAGETHVDFTLEPDDAGILLTLNHSGFDESTPVEIIQHYNTLWENRLDQLKSILEVGGPTDIINRVIIGIIPGQGIPEHLNVAVDDGVHVSTVLPDFSAAGAGMQVDDVIVSVNGHAVTSGSTIHEAVGDLKPGDTVDVAWYRGETKHTAAMELRGYPVPPIPEQWEEMAVRFIDRHHTLDNLLDAALAGYDDSLADFRLSEEQRTIPQTLAHIILMQRHTLQYFASYAHGPRIITPFSSNTPWIDAVVGSHTSVDALRAEIRRVGDEIVSVIRQFPPTLLERKNYPWWMNFEVHFQIIQFERDAAHIKQTVAAA